MLRMFEGKIQLEFYVGLYNSKLCERRREEGNFGGRKVVQDRVTREMTMVASIGAMRGSWSKGKEVGYSPSGDRIGRPYKPIV